MPDELELLKSLGRELAEPDEESIDRARSLLEERIGSSPRSSSPSRLRRGVIVVAAALLIGSGLGFGVGSFVTPSSSAGVQLEGFGFVTAQGWSVTQTGSLAQFGAARAVASTVPLAAGDEAKVLPYATLRRLAPGSAVVVARLSPRGDTDTDRSFPLRSLPLRVADAASADLPRTLLGTSLVSLRIRAATDGYNVDARVFFGGPPSSAAISRVDDQLRRLVIAPGSVTLVVQPRVLRAWNEPMTIFGSVSTGEAEQKVTIQFKACGVNPIQYRDAFETTTRAGGGYTLSGPGAYRPPSPGVSGVFRAVSGDSVSAEVPVQHRASIFLRPRDGGRTFQIFASGKVSFWRKVVLLQRFERRRGVWLTVRRLRLTDSGVGGGGAGTPQFRPSVPKATLIRAVLPLSEARPCYLEGYSQTWRT